MAAPKKSQSGKATITKTEHTAQGNEIVHPLEQEEVVAPGKEPSNPCVVGCGAGMTIPTEPYANVRLDVYLSVTVEFGEHDEAFDFVSTWVGEKLQSMADGVKGA